MCNVSSGKSLKDIRYIYPVVFLGFGYVFEVLPLSITGLYIFTSYFIIKWRATAFIKLVNTGKAKVYHWEKNAK